TPEGYYAASPGGEALMGWHVNQGKDKLAAFYPAEQFRASLYRPDVLRRIFESGSVQEAVAAANKARGQAGEVRDINELVPPEVAIVSPAEPVLHLEKKTTVQIKFKAKSQSKYPIDSVWLLVDGRPLPKKQGLFLVRPAKKDGVEGSFTVEL